MPELVFVEVDSALGRNEPDQEIRDLLQRSVGLNLALDFLPGSTMFDPAAGDTADPFTASLAVWFDAFVLNVDRTPRNPNLLRWHRELYFIDHGAALYFHHNWSSLERMIESPFRPVCEHVLLPWASAIARAGETAAARLNETVFTAVLADVPDAWLIPDIGAVPATRAAYVDFLTRRLQGASHFVEEAIRARAELV